MTAPKRAWAPDGRSFRRVLVAKSVKQADGRIELRSPGVGMFRGMPAPGSLVLPGGSIGELEALGVLHELRADPTSHGLVTGEAPPLRRARVPVAFGDVLLVIDPSAGAVIEAEAEAERGPEAHGLVFRAPSSGRFYLRSAPDKDPFVSEGATIEEGTTLCLLEIMKTFHRIGYGGGQLPRRAKVTRIAVADGADVEIGDVLFELEKA